MIQKYSDSLLDLHYTNNFDCNDVMRFVFLFCMLVNLLFLKGINVKMNLKYLSYFTIY